MRCSRGASPRSARRPGEAPTDGAGCDRRAVADPCAIGHGSGVRLDRRRARRNGLCFADRAPMFRTSGRAGRRVPDRAQARWPAGASPRPPDRPPVPLNPRSHPRRHGDPASPFAVRADPSARADRPLVGRGGRVARPRPGRAARLRRPGRAPWLGRGEHLHHPGRSLGARSPAGTQRARGRSVLRILPAFPAAEHRTPRIRVAIAGIRLHHQRRWLHPDQRACGGRRRRHHRPPDRQARVPGESRRVRPANRRGRAEDRGVRPAAGDPGRPQQAPGRRVGGRDRLAVRLRQQRHRGHRQREGPGAAPGEFRTVHPDRRGDQPRQFRRPVVQPARRGDRDQLADLQPHGRLHGPVVRHSDRRGHGHRPAAAHERTGRARPHRGW